MNTANKVAAISLAVMGVLIVGVMVVVSNSKTEAARAYFDNGLDRQVKISVDGQDAGTLPPHSASVYESISVGKHTIRVVDDKGEQIEETPVEVTAASGITNRRWVYNVSAKSTYRVRYVMYGNGEPPKSFDLADGKTFFELPDANSNFLPAEMPSEKAKAGKQLSVVGHREVHPNLACCANLRALIAPSKK